MEFMVTIFVPFFVFVGVMSLCTDFKLSKHIHSANRLGKHLRLKVLSVFGWGTPETCVVAPAQCAKTENLAQDQRDPYHTYWTHRSRAIAEGMDPEVRGFDNLKEAEDFYLKQVLNEDKYFHNISLQEETSTPGSQEVAASVQHVDGELYAGHEEPYILDGNENKGLRDFLFNK